jgi:hypothetical protein
VILSGGSRSENHFRSWPPLAYQSALPRGRKSISSIHDTAGRAEPGQTGTFIYSADDILGPYAYTGGPVAAPDGPLGPLYAGELVQS